MHQLEGANPSVLTISSLWCSQSTCLPLMREITGLSAIVLLTKAGTKPVRDATFIALKALAAMHSLGKRIQLGATPSEGSAVEPALKRVS